MRSQHAVQISLRARKRATGPAAAAHPDPRRTMSPSFDAEDASVVKVDVRDPQSAARDSHRQPRGLQYSSNSSHFISVDQAERL